MRSLFSGILFGVIASLGIREVSAQAANAQVHFQIVDQKSGRPSPCRIHLKDPAGKAVRANPLPFFRDHFVCTGEVRLDLPLGPYWYEIERGPEYFAQTGNFTLSGDTNLAFKLERLADMAAEGWWAGDLHVHRPLPEIELLMQAEDLHIAPVITWWNKQNLWLTNRIPAKPLVRFDKNRFYHVMGGEDEREGGALLYFHLSEPLSISRATREYPSPLKFLAEAKQHKQAWADIEKPFWWDAPIWLASGRADSIGLANNHMNRGGMLADEAWGRPRDAQRLPPPRGNGFWTQEIYYHILNCGLRVPPSAGSASGVLPNPVGYNRVYVHTGKTLDWEEWWEGLRAGRSFVSNGPLLRCKANGQWPGHTFSAVKGREIKIEIRADISGRDSIPSIEIIKNGKLERAVPFQDWKRNGSLGPISFQESGWFLVRAIADDAKTFRFASSAPFYVEIGQAKTRISKSSVQFFLDWVQERAHRVQLADAIQKAEVLKDHEMARAFWEHRLTQANAE